jgi:hypothetical protein
LQGEVLDEKDATEILRQMKEVLWRGAKVVVSRR